jgi:hypothetical protein
MLAASFCSKRSTSTNNSILLPKPLDKVGLGRPVIMLRDWATHLEVYNLWGLFFLTRGVRLARLT